MLTGENGILTQAQKAKNETENAAKNETEILDNYNNTINNWVSEGKTEETFDASDLTIEEALNVEKYGWKVPSYTVQAGDMTTNVWRLFYQDSNYTYLITDECVGNYKPSDYYTGVYNTGADVSLIGQKLNPILLENGNFFTTDNTNPNILATAWLTDPNKWAEFKNSDAVFAIGSPTVELYAKSFNATANINKENKIDLIVGTDGYIDMSSYNLKEEYNNGIYCKEDIDWWLASPYDNGDNCQFGADSNGYLISYDPSASTVPLRPIVCIPTSVFNEKYLSSLVNE